MQLLALLEDSSAFTQLKRHFNRFNPLKVLAVDQFEIRHSNFLAWLLDAKGNHQLGDFFIRKLLTKTFLNPANSEEEDKLSNYDLKSFVRMHFQDLEVYKELQTNNGKRIDLLAVSPRNKLVVLIENKFHSTESEGQLEEYIEFAKATYPAYQIVPIFLTLQNEVPTHEDYLMLGYDDLLDVLDTLLQTQKSYMNQQIYDFLCYYNEILTDILEDDEDLNELALTVFRDHQDAVKCLQASAKKPVDDPYLFDLYLENRQTIDFIIRVGDSLMLEAFKEFVQTKEWPEQLSNVHFKRPSFVESDWHGVYSAEDLRENWWLNEGFIAWFERIGERLKLTVEVGPLHQEKREPLLRSLEAAGIPIRPSAFEEGKKYTSIYTSFIEPVNWDTKEAIRSAMGALYKEQSYQQLAEQIKTALGLSTVDNSQKPSSPAVVMQDSFTAFMKSIECKSAHYASHKRTPNFVETEWTQLAGSFPVTKTYWLGYPLIAWFEKTSKGLRLFVEVGPVEPHAKRVELLKTLEAEGIVIRALAFEEGRKYTKIFSELVQVEDWKDAVRVMDSMKSLYTGPAYQGLKNKIYRAVKSL
ncbi:PD-(D/E)XK nuclease family protein [Sporosarcina sp.]|uniref:PDDEXK-like family protein n=1 Tax=Sporosarcina sp. TaxID=49982 RepID=UPI002604C95B|nr:PD-(D/E)XK nuclease family protein [Sporosarcina sp.]